jgi:hypothetical protein
MQASILPDYLCAGRPAVRHHDGRETVLSCVEEQPFGEGVLRIFIAAGVRVEVQYVPLDGGWRVAFTVAADPAAFADADRLVVLDAPLDGFARVFTPRREIWLPAGSRAVDGSGLPDGPDPRWDAENVIALYTPDGSALVCGVQMPAHTPYELAARDGRLRVCTLLPDGLPTRMMPDALLLRDDLALTEALEWYGAHNRIAVRTPAQKGALVAWNSWDWFGDAIRREHVLTMVEVIRRDPLLCDTVGAIVLDDGWAVRGDWTQPNERFPDLDGMATVIADAGFVPGIWVSPFRVDKHCAWVREHPETVLWGEPRGYYPKPLGEEAANWMLDYSHPLVIEKLYRDFAWLRGLGFRYFKTDFLQGPNSNFGRPNLHNPGVTQIEGMRHAMEAIRAGIGYDSYWLACGTELAPLAGLADASRVCDDIRLHASSLQLAVRNCANYFWANGNLWLNDPDFLVVRGPETSTTPDLSARGEPDFDPRTEKPYSRVSVATGPLWSADDARCWANFHIVYGGVLSLGDHPTHLTEEARAMIELALRYNTPGAVGVPLDLDTRALPSRWLRPYPGGWLLGYFNWDDAPATIALSARDLARIGPARRAVDIRTDEPAPWAGDAFAVELPPHTSRVWRVER